MPWGNISYSAYTALRTGDPDYFISASEEPALLRGTVKRLIQLSGRKKHIANPEMVCNDTVRYFEQGGMPGCKAGRHFFVVMPMACLCLARCSGNGSRPRPRWSVSLHVATAAASGSWRYVLIRTAHCSDCCYRIRRGWLGGCSIATFRIRRKRTTGALARRVGPDRTGRSQSRRTPGSGQSDLQMSLPRIS